MLVAVGFSLFVVCSVLTFHYVDKIQQKPYMDEIFHIPQATQFCNANFTHWDPMITTLPGLYLVSVGWMKPVTSLLNIHIMDLCTTFWLRGINLLFAAGNFYLIYSILKKLHNPLLDTEMGVKLSMTTLALSTFPVLYFFTFLYYTDPGAIFFVLIMYLFCLYESHWIAAMMAVVAILFRQTNIIWVVFAAGLAVGRELSIWMRDIHQKKDTKLNDLSDWDMFKLTVETVANCAVKNIFFIDLVKKILKKVIGYIAVGVGFGVFILWNNGIVVGDRSQHVACLHFPQLFYFLTMANFFAVFQLTSPYKIIDFMKFCWRHPVFVLSFIVVAFLMIHYFTHEHMYLLSDNRHYTFYVWHKIYRKHEYVKYALIPVYLYSLWAFMVQLADRDVFWKIVYFVCVFASTIPQQLLEYRYFILPYLIYRMNMRYSSAVGLLHEILLYTVVNIVTVYLYTQKTFKWPHEDGIQRFMW